MKAKRSMTPAAWLSNWPQWPSMAPEGSGLPAASLEDRVNDAGGEDAGEQGADGSAGSMHAKGVEGVVVAEDGS